jgi:hypothetical protein
MAEDPPQRSQYGNDSLVCGQVVYHSLSVCVEDTV